VSPTFPTELRAWDLLPAHWKPVARDSCPRVSEHTPDGPAQPLERAWRVFLFRSPGWTRVCGRPGRIPWCFPTRPWKLLCKRSLTPTTRPHKFIYSLLCLHTGEEHGRKSAHLAIQFKESNPLNQGQGKESVPVSRTSSLFMNLPTFSLSLVHRLVEN